jgi:hypothetical protein
VRLPLSSGPELVDEVGYTSFVLFDGGLPEGIEPADELHEGLTTLLPLNSRFGLNLHWLG